MNRLIMILSCLLVAVSLFALPCRGMIVNDSIKADKYEGMVQQAIDAVAKGDLQEAEDKYLHVLRIAPKDHRNVLVHASLGRVREQMGRDMDALESYTYALNLAPLSVPILTSRADLYLRLGNNVKALVDYGNIVDVDPNNVHARCCKGYILSKERRYTEARIDYERALEVEPDNYAANLGLAILNQATGKRGEAITAVTMLIKKYPAKAELYSVRAEMELQAGSADLAVMDLNKAIELEPENKNYVLTRAYIHLKEGNKFYARSDFERAIELGVPRGQLKKELKEVK